jgi:hypothetical protein
MSMAKNFRSLDIVSPKIELLHLGSTNLKTYIGSILTLIIVIFFIYSISYFGSDLILREQPITRYSKEYSNSSRIYLKDYPIRVLVTDGLGGILPRDKFMRVQGTYFKLGFNNKDNFVNFGYLFMEPCRDEFIPSGLLAIAKSSGESKFNNSLCINPSKYILTNGTVVQEDIFIQNTFSATESTYIKINLFPCVNTTENNSTCLPTDEQNEMVGRTTLVTAFFDSYIDYSNYDKPETYFAARVATQLTNEDTKKAHFLTLKQTKIKTDSGIVMENSNERTIMQVDSVKTDIYNGNNFYKFQIDGNNVNDLHVRKYIKVQDIIASIGGLIKFLFIIASLSVEFFGKLGMRLEIINSLYRLPNEVKDCRPPNSSINHFKNKENETNVIKFNNNKRVSVSSSPDIPITASVVDYLRSLLRCKSVYGKIMYRQFNNYIYSKLEISNVIRDSLYLEKLMAIMLKEEQYHEIENKRLIILDAEGKMELKEMKGNILKVSRSPKI